MTKVEKARLGRISAKNLKPSIRDEHHSRKRLKEGLDINVNGKVYRLYQTGKLPSILGSLGFPRSIDTIKNWLKKGIIPDTPIKLDSYGKGTRFFPREYIERLALIGKESGISTGNPLQSTNFVSRCSLELTRILDDLLEGRL